MRTFFIFFSICIISVFASTPWLNENSTDSGISEGDIAFKDAPDSNEQTRETEDHQGHAAASELIRKWENKIVPFLISSTFDHKQRAIISDAMMEIEDNTCISFVPRQLQKDYILFKKLDHGSICSSIVGRLESGGRQHVNLTDECVGRNTVLHELMHVLGFHHEHSRHDRDKYIQINLNHVRVKHQQNLEFKRKVDPLDLHLPYDYRSITHYPVDAYSTYINGITIRSKIPWFRIKADGLSDIDIWKIKYMYNCSKEGESVASSNEHAEDTTTNVPNIRTVDQQRRYQVETDTIQITTSQLPTIQSTIQQVQTTSSTTNTETSIDGPQLFANNELLNEDVELNMKSKDTIRLECRLNGKIQWILPNNTEYQDYSNPMIDGRCNIETLENQSILTINDLRYTDTGLYKCVSRNDSNEDNDENSSSTRIEIGAYVFVKDDNPNHLFMDFIDNIITVYEDRESYLNCKITDPNAKVDLLIGGEAKTDFEYDKQKGFRVPVGSLEHLSYLNEMECVATNPSTNTTDSIIMLLLMIERKPNTLIVNIYPDNADKLFYLNNQLNLHCNVTNYKLQKCSWSYPRASNILVNERTHSMFLDSVNWSNNGTYKCTCQNLAFPDQYNSSKIHGIVRKTKSLIKFVHSGHEFNAYKKVVKFYANVDIFVPESIRKEEISVQWFHKQSNVQYGGTTVPVLYSIGVGLLNEVDLAWAKWQRSADQGQGLSFANKQIKLLMGNVRLRQSGEYSLVVKAGDAEMNMTFPLLVNATTRAELYVSDTISLSKGLDPNYLEKDKPCKLWCIAEGIPLKRPHLVFCPCVLEQGEQCSESCVELEEGSDFDTAQIETKIGTYQWAIVVSLNATTSGTFKCKVGAAQSYNISFVVTDIVDSQAHSGFSTELARSNFEHQGPDDVYLHDSAVLNCKIQKYNDKFGVSWYFKPNSVSTWRRLKVEGLEKRQSTNYSHVYQLTLNDIQLDQSGVYKCVRNSDKVSRERNLKVRISRRPSERNTTIERDLYFRYTTSNAMIKCDVQGVPFPKITWSKDGVPLSARYELNEKNTKITIGTIVAEDEGKYLCTMENPAGKSTTEFRVHVTGY